MAAAPAGAGVAVSTGAAVGARVAVAAGLAGAIVAVGWAGGCGTSVTVALWQLVHMLIVKLVWSAGNGCVLPRA